MMLVPVRVAPSKLHGLGIFAEEAIPANAPVWALSEGLDLVIPPDRFLGWTGVQADFLARYAYFDAAKSAYVLCVDDARFMNHSTDPNVSDTVDDRCHALRDIAAGEELTCDYRRLDPRPMLFAART